MSDIKNITYLQDQLAASKAENQALAEALQACLPLWDMQAEDAEAEGLRKAATAARNSAAHIRSLLGLPQP
jgi:inorganic triphosphatase YgiF